MMVSGYDDSLQEAEKWGRVANGARVVCDSTGLSRFRRAGDNAFRIVCKDDAGAALESACSDDVDVVVEGGTVSSCDVVAPGVVELCYGVVDPGVTALTLHVNAFGASVAGSPWGVRGGLANKCVQTIKVRGDAFCIAVSPDGSLLAVISSCSDNVRIFSLPDGVLVRVLNAEDVTVESDSELSNPLGVCQCSSFSADGDLVAAEDAVYETAITGAPLRNFRMEDDCEPGYVSVTTDGSVVVAITVAELVVFDYASRDVLHRVESYGSPGHDVEDLTSGQCTGVALTADKHILVADAEKGAVFKFTLDCVYVGTVCSFAGSSPQSLTETEDGELIIADPGCKQFHILSDGREGECVCPPEVKGGWVRPFAVASRGRFVYLLDYELRSVFVYE
ncbi:MAG: hypothetical protein P4L40_17370 [Terracidiphilus sp.]|nr:hypothetical protein [Terracidiphilus sp.]